LIQFIKISNSNPLESDMPMKKLLSLASIFFIIGCGGGGGGSDESTISYAPTKSNQTLSSSEYSVSIKKVDKSNVITSNTLIYDETKGYAIKTFYGSTALTVRTNSPRDVYLVLTNSSSNSDINSIQEQEWQKALKSKTYQKVLDYRINFKKYLAKENPEDQEDEEETFNYERRFKSVGDKKSFFLDQNGEKTTTTTLRLTRTVNTAFGDKTLNIYVSDDSFDDGNGCPKEFCVTQEMVDVLADKFLKSGSDNDIYDWETNIYGEEWGADASEKVDSKLIGDNDEITILLTDIDGDNDSKRGIIGYFWAKDNLTNIKGSNKEIMFYIDSVMYANHANRDTWTPDQKMPMEVLSTLAHEFQHMISFYQKTVLIGKGASSTTWLDETLSCATEYILSSKIKTFTPRQVSYEDGSAGDFPISDGQFPDFNKYLNSYNLMSWRNTAAQYGGAYALGAYLVQNYGGAKLLHNIMHNQYFDERALLKGIKTTTGESLSLRDLLNRCGTAITISDQILDPIDDKPYLFNSGDYNCQSYNATTYCMGSINFFNYNPKPNFTTAKDGDILSGSNRYVYLQYDVDGDYNIALNLGEGVMATVIVK